MRRVLAAVAFLFLCSGPAAIAYDCRYAIDRYNTAISEVSYRLKGYANCVSDSQANDDCSIEFGRLRWAHDEFETSVGDIGVYCRR